MEKFEINIATRPILVLIPWIEHLIPSEGEEASVRIKGSLEQLAEELSK